MVVNAVLSALGVFLKLLCGLAINKILSVQLGPAAFGVWGNVFSLTTLYTSFANGGITSGLIAKLSAPGQSKAQRDRWLSGGLAFAIFAPLAITLFHGIARYFDLIPGIGYLPVTAVLILTMAAAIALHIQAATLSEGKPKLNSLVVGLTGPLSLLAYYLIVKPESIESAVTGLLLSTGIVLVLWFAVAGMKVQWRPAMVSAFEVKAAVRVLGPYLAIAIAPALVGTASIIAIRETISIYLGAEAAGLWQGLFRISDAVVAVAQAAVAFVLLPAIFRSPSPRLAFIRYIRIYLLIVMASLVCGQLIIAFGSQEIVVLLYSDQFLGIADLLWIQFLGDTLKVMAMPFVAFFIYQRRLGISWGLEVLFSGSFFVFCYALIQQLGLAGSAMAYASANFVLLICAAYLFWRGRNV